MSIPPPNHFFPVSIYLVLKCKEGIFGFLGCITTEIPEAQNFLLFDVPGICFENFLSKLPNTVDMFTPTFSKTLPSRKIEISPPPLDSFFRLHFFFLNFVFFSNFSNSLQIKSLKYLNHFSISFLFLYI